jgi:hypothetical protein
MRIREIAQTRVRYGYRKIRVLLNREGWKWTVDEIPLPQRPPAPIVHIESSPSPAPPNPAARWICARF